MFDVLITGGTIVDGTGEAARRADLGLIGDKVAAIGDLADADCGIVVEADGLIVAPGFINPLSHSYFSMLQDPRSMSELVQGVTTQAFGEGESMGPLSGPMHAAMRTRLADRGIDVNWTRLSEFLSMAASLGVSQNVCSFVGAATLREHVVGLDDREATPHETDLMKALLAEEMEDGALGVGSALIYPPGSFASTAELAELCKVAGSYGGSYISHMRSEGDRVLEAIEELVAIATRGELPAEVFHLKTIGQRNWPLMDAAVERIVRARESGLEITADVYPYTAGGTQLHACLPPWLHDGGFDHLLERLRDPQTRDAAKRAMEIDEGGWENLYAGCGGPDGILVLHVNEPYHHLVGRTLAEIGKELGVEPTEALIRLVEVTPPDDQGGVFCAFFMMSEPNVESLMRLPWISLGSDAASVAAEPPFSDEPTHPRAYGSFARFLGRYVRELRVCSLPEAIRRITALPAGNLHLTGRGLLQVGAFADVVVFDPAEIADLAVYEAPHRYATGVRDVIVNGVITLRDCAFTGQLAGRHLRRGVRS